MIDALRKITLAAAAAGALLSAAAPAEAFTLSAPSSAPAVAGADVDHVWYDQWGRWHPNRGYYPRPHYRCWVNRYGVRQCSW